MIGQVWSRHSFGTVTGVTATAIKVMNEFGKEWEVDPKLFADEFSAVGLTAPGGQVVKLTQTELSAKFSELPRQAVTVSFNKKLDEKDLIKKVQALHGQPKPAFDKAVKEVLADVRGDERVMQGYHYGGVDGFGRIHFTEIAPDKAGKQAVLKPNDGKTYDARHRLVDPRTINWFIAGGVRYEVK